MSGSRHETKIGIVWWEKVTARSSVGRRGMVYYHGKSFLEGSERCSDKLSEIEEDMNSSDV